MRDKYRIDIILNQIHEIWLNYPDIRLGQLLLNATKDSELYYLEDENLIKKLEEYYK